MKVTITIEGDSINMAIEKSDKKGITESERKQLVVIGAVIENLLIEHEKEGNAIGCG